MFERLRNRQTIGFALLQKENLSRSLASSAERLSSGIRITHPSDDPAGYAIALQLKARSSTSTASLRNISDAMSVVNITEQAIEEGIDILTRIEELATQASSSLLSSTQRSALNSEAQALATELNRITANTKFNGRSIFTTTSSLIVAIDATGTNSSYEVLSSVQTLASGTLSVTTTSSTSSTVGYGTFSASKTYTIDGTGFLPKVLTRDVNGDSKADLITISDNSVLCVSLGNGDGTFAAKITYFMGTNFDPTDLAFGYVDGDSVLDVVVSGGLAGGAGGRISVLLGNSGGSFSAPKTFAGYNDRLEEVALADLNGDTFLDVITASGNNGRSAIIYFGNNNGTFQAPITINAGAGTEPYGVAVGDLDGDGDNDIVTANNLSGNVSVLFNSGTGTFGSPVTYPSGGTMWGPKAVEIIDYDGDSVKDIISISEDLDSIWFFRNTGSGAFAAPISYQVGNGPVDFLYQDITGDGYKDIVTVDEGSETVTVRVGNSNGTFKAPTSYLTAAPTVNAEGLTAADFNGDNIVDLAVSLADVGKIAILLGNGTSTTTSTSSTVTSTMGAFAVDLSTITAAQSSLTLTTSAKSQYLLVQGSINASLARLENSDNFVLNYRENVEEAYSRIIDIDIATEVALYTSLTIREQAVTAVLASANQDAQRVLALLE